MKILIIEDELLIAEMLKSMLTKLGYEVVSIIDSFEETVRFIEDNSEIDVVFLDINLEAEKSGVDIANWLNQEYGLPFVYLTSYSDPKTVVEASKTLPEAYINKPFNETLLLTTLEVVKEKILQKPKYIFIQDGVKKIKMAHDDLIYVKSDRNYLEVYTTKGRYISRTSMDKFIKALNISTFIKVHRSYAVNLNKVLQISGTSLILSEEKIPISRNLKPQVVNAFYD